MRGRILTGLLAVSTISAQEGAPLETEHYRIRADGDAEEPGALLEAAFAGFQRYFGKKPAGKLDVRFAAGEEPRYDPATKTAFARPQGTRYGTRAVLLREASRQFQWLARGRNEPPVAFWYREGMAEHLASHFWDGRKLELGVLPLVSPTDYAAAALAKAEEEGFDLAQVVDGAVEDRALAWALVRFLDTQEKKKFDPFARKMDGGNEPQRLFRKLVGDPKALQPRFVEWLRKEQEPWSQVGQEWSAASPDRIRGSSSGRVGCYLKAPVQLLQFTLPIPDAKKWMAGALLHCAGEDDWSVALLDWGGFIRIQRWNGKAWQILEQGEVKGLDEDGKYRVQLFRRGDSVTMMIGKSAGYGAWELPGTTLGLAVEGCDVEFTEVSWR